jgi:ActR/RegA family two-component response regulator
MATMTRSVMIVDHSPSGKRLSEGIAQAGFRMTEAATFEAARALLDVEEPDFVIVEPWLGNASWDFIVDVRQVRPRTRVIVVTACASIPSALALLALGVSDFFAKPVTISQVLPVLDWHPIIAPSSSRTWMSIDDACGNYIEDVLHACGSIAKTARALGVDRRSLRRMLARRAPASPGASREGEGCVSEDVHSNAYSHTLAPNNLAMLTDRPIAPAKPHA